MNWLFNDWISSESTLTWCSPTNFLASIEVYTTRNVERVRVHPKLLIESSSSLDHFMKSFHVQFDHQQTIDASLQQTLVHSRNSRSRFICVSTPNAVSHDVTATPTVKPQYTTHTSSYSLCAYTQPHSVHSKSVVDVCSQLYSVFVTSPMVYQV